MLYRGTKYEKQHYRKYSPCSEMPNFSPLFTQKMKSQGDEG
jgi:hypothetical protein